MMGIAFNGIQQLGVGVENLQEAWEWYRKYFGMDICVFEEAAVAELMLAHTNGKPRARHAVLALNMEGGGGFEVWQHTGKKPEPIGFQLQLGDLGIIAGKLKTKDIRAAYQYFTYNSLNVINKISKDPAGVEHFYLYDPYQNIWEVVADDYVFKAQKSVTGGIFGTTIGVKNIDESLVVYRDILGYDKVIYDETAIFNDFIGLPGANGRFRRIRLKHSSPTKGPFSSLFGPSSIELIQALDREGVDIYKDRIWGDPGFIHICYDIMGMDALRTSVKEKGYPFTVDSGKAMDTFDMGEAAGSFAYIQAPEGTLIEFVETHKVPVIKKIGWYLNLRKRDNKPFPRWILSLFSLKRVK